MIILRRRMLLAKFSSAEESLRCRKTFQALLACDFDKLFSAALYLLIGLCFGMFGWLSW